MPEFTIWIDYYPEDDHPRGDIWVEVLYFNGRVQRGMAWEVDWDNVSQYREEIIL